MSITKDILKKSALLPIEYPVIAPVSENINRPFWSVMIPTYNRSKYLEETLKSVLCQNYSSAEMQIEVVDNCSTKGEIEKIVKEIGHNRVDFYKQPHNVGMSSNWNTCINRARGRWVHILHDDDIVLPGFYRCLQSAVEQNLTIGSAFCRYIYIGEEGERRSLSTLEIETPATLKNWLERIAVESVIYAPAVVVKRDVYEQLGGFCSEAYSATDWEMWKRIAANYPVWYEPQPLACYRQHSASDMSRLLMSGANIADARRAIEITKSYLPESIATKLSERANENYALCALNLAEYNIAIGQIDVAVAQIRQALLCSQSFTIVKKVASLFLWGVARSLWHGLRAILSFDRQNSSEVQKSQSD